MGRHTIGLFITNPIDRRLLSDFLRELGHEVYTSALSAREPEVCPDSSLVISDEAAARLYGNSLLELKWRAGVDFLPLLIVLPQKSNSASWLQVGFDDVLRQPVTKDELKARLEVFLRFRRHSEQYRLIFENALVGIYRSTPDGHLLLANPTLVRMLGFSSFDELSQETLKEQGVRTEPARRALAERLAREGQVTGLESAWTRRDGTTLFALESARAVRDEAGHMLYFEGSVEDITGRKRAEAKLLQLAAIVENSDDAIVSKDLDGTIISWNPGAERLYGYMAAEAIGRSVTILIPPDMPDEEPHIIERIKRGERVDHYETVRLRKDGTLVDVSLTVSPVKNESGHIIGASHIARDITDRKRAEDALREQTEVVETINRVGQTLSAELDLHKVVQTVTDAATDLVGARFGSFFYNVLDEQGGSYMLYTLSGVPREAFAHFPMPRATDLFGPTFRGEGVVRIEDVKLDPRYGKNSPYHGMPKGHLPVVSYLAVPVISRSGEVLGGLFFGHPEAAVFTERVERIVTGLAAQAAIAMDNARLFDLAGRERAQAESAARENARLYEEAERANCLKDEFLATVSHELRTPLTAIIGWSTLLRNNNLDAANAAIAIETIGRNARAQSQLIEDLMDVSRIITGKLRLDVQPVELESVIEAAIDSLRPAAEARGIRLLSVLDPHAGPVSGDPTRLQQVAWNLLSNAIKFTPKGGRVEVRLERINSHIEFVVSDTGAGIEPEFLPYVFDRFRQADGTTTRAHGGLGLGLAIVRHLVDLHGGSVRVDSPGKGQGATFTVILPLRIIKRELGSEERRHPATEIGATTECPPELDGLRVLIVDDEPDARHLLKIILEQCGAEVTVVASVREAIKEIERSRPDVLVSDVGMPEEDGYTLMRKVRALDAERGGQIPAAALTAYAGAEDRKRALLAGFQVHIPKPVDPVELVAAVASLAGRTGKT